MNETQFPLLWSEDLDRGLGSRGLLTNNTSSRKEFNTKLAGSTDVAFDEPPKDVETWNHGDFQDFDPGDTETSVHPEGAQLENGLSIQDVYVSIFAIQPSTVVHSRNHSTQYIAPDGDVLAVTDYRIESPDDDTNGSTREQWTVLESGIERVELRANGRVIDSTTSHRSTFEYSGLSGTQNLSVAVEISAKLRHDIGTCDEYDSTADRCDGSWETETEYQDERLRAADSRHTVVNRFTDSVGRRVTFENNENRTGIAIHPGTTWSAIEVSDDARLRGNWRFYSAGIDGWHTMVSRTETDTTRRNSSVRPAQIHALPTQKRPDMPSKATDDAEPPLVIEEVWGLEQGGPSLPDVVGIETVDRYVHLTSIAVRSDTLPADSVDEVTVHGIVRGQSQTIPLEDGGTVHKSNLELTILEADASGTRVRATVTDPATGDPIPTGRVKIGNQSVPVNASGVAVLELDGQYTSLVDGTYVPKEWWHGGRLYSASEDRVAPSPDYPDFQRLVQLVIVTIFLFIPVSLAVYGFDYLTGGALLGLRDKP
ncbi:hypothetical protein [Natrinema gelatinilyticum]|uniref:hypothetical protein n=1 Tax=Natrinema gelatinilyticum TaxID=2961571 RepID=UPI0020C5660F|nr:hypothetical protein [Natrinema gelatinilyticum]